MGEGSKIEWTDHTFNPWWGCQKVSDGCRSCYAETLANRYGHAVWGPTNHSPRRFFGDEHWAEPLKWNRKAEQVGRRARVFCASMADVFEDYRILDDQRTRLWELIEQTPWLDWLLLTKRPELMITLTPEAWRRRWPDNAWALTSVESQELADRRIPELLKVPARIRGLSCEPLLGPVDLGLAIPCGYYCDEAAGHVDHPFWSPGIASPIHWVIAGGESGPKARAPHPDWFRSLRDQCQAAGVAYFFKQWGEELPKGQGNHGLDERGLFRRESYIGGHAYYRVGKQAAGRLLDGRTWDEVPQ